MNALVNSHLFLTCSGGGGGVILVCFPQQLAWQFRLVVWHLSHTSGRELLGIILFSSSLLLIYYNIFYFTIIICNCLPGVPKSDSRPAWRLRRFFISSVEDAILERSAALESLCYGIGLGRLGRRPLFIVLHLYLLCNSGCSPTWWLSSSS